MKLKTYVPNRLPLRSLNWETIIGLIGKAHAVIARYDEILRSVSRPTSVFSLLTSAEAIDSLHSQKVSLSVEELCVYEAKDIKTADGHEEEVVKILNYRRALQNAGRWVVKYPISLALFCKIHGTIGQDAKSAKKEIGQFRERQNWIGQAGCGIEEAYFYPPSVRILGRCLRNLKHYLAYEEKDPLIQLAIFFAQLLIIHPFMDGNGRVARVLIPLFLYKKKLVSSPLFYLSAYFKKHRLKYFEKLFLITSENDWEEWIHFFLKGIIEEGERQILKGRAMLSLYHRFNEVIGHSDSARAAIDALFALPVLKREKWIQQKRAVKSLERLEAQKWIVPYKAKSMVAVKELLTIGLL